MSEMDLLIDLHRGGHRQGPGSVHHTRLALRLAGLEGGSGLRIADIGCGTGAATLVLARELDADMTAIDLLPEFLTDLDQRAATAAIKGRITTRAQDMADLDFPPGSLDVIWSEGAIYNIGFETGVRQWRDFLKPGGILAVSELSWLTNDRPDELTDYWQKAYPGVATASEKIAILEAAGYALEGYFPLPASAWLDEYYRPMQARFDGFLKRQKDSRAALRIVEAERQEIAFYERFHAYYSYGFYIARKTDNRP